MNKVSPNRQLSFRSKASQQSVRLTGGSLCHFQVFFTPKQNPVLEVLSTPAHSQAPIHSAQGVPQTHAVRRLEGC